MQIEQSLRELLWNPEMVAGLPKLVLSLGIAALLGVILIFHLRHVSSYIGLESPEKGCGKTNLLGVLSQLVNRPVVAPNISSSAFFRVIEDLHAATRALHSA